MSKIDYNELVEFVRTHDEYYVAEFMFADNKRIAELEQELAELKEKYNKTNEKLKNITEEIDNNFVHGQDYEKLKQELLELKEKAIIPKFKIGQEVWAISVYRLNCVDWFIITEIGYCADYGLFYKTNMGINLYEYYYKIFDTEQEAQAKLQELRGGE